MSKNTNRKQKPTVGVGLEEEILYRKAFETYVGNPFIIRTQQFRICIPRANSKPRHNCEVDILKWCSSGLT